MGDCLTQAWAFGPLLEQRGVRGGGRFFVSVAHTDADIDETLQRADDACKKLSGKEL